MTEAEIELRKRCAEAGPNLQVDKLPFVLNQGQIFLGDHVAFSGHSDIQFSNIESKKPELRVGNRTFIGHGCSFHIARSIVIGDYCNIAEGVVVRDFDGHPMEAMARRTQPTPAAGIGAIRIEDDVWIGTRAMILKGVTIGARSVVAAMSLVASDVPPDTLVAGNPARAVRALNGMRAAVLSAPSDGSVAGRVRWVVAQQAGIAEEEVELDLSAEHYGIDSLRLLILRECLESEFGLAFTENAWMSFRSLRQIVDFCEMRTPPRAPMVERRVALGGDILRTRIDIGIPLTGRNHLAEGPLLQRLGDVRWNHIQSLSGVAANQIFDAEGAQLYPTFFYVDLCFPERRPMADFRLDDWFDAVCGVERYGTSVLDGITRLLPGETSPPDNAGDLPYVRLSNIFVAHHNGADWLKKSRPADPGFLRIPSLTAAPDSIQLARSAAQEGCFSAPPAHYLSLLPRAARIRYTLLPDRDLNAAGLVYFAHYPVFLDIAEREALGAAEISFPQELLDRRTVVRRQSAFLSNASARDTLLIEVEPWIRDPFDAGDPEAEDSPLRLWLNFRMYRESDGRLMMVSTAQKFIYQKTLRDAPGLLSGMRARRDK